MKSLYPIRIFILFLCSITIYSNSYSQCKEGESSKSISYDTTFSGGGNDMYSFSFPQFDPSIGTLVKVNIETLITVRYNYQLENTDANPILYRVRVNRTDEINCSALLVPLSKTQTKTINTHLLERYDGIPGSGADYVAVGPVYAFNQYPINYSVDGEVAGFLGNGSVNFDYSSITDSYPSGSSHYLYSTSANDSITLRLTYYYCAVSFLPADITSFTASKLSSGTVKLTWYTPNDLVGQTYDVEKSTDGRVFTSVQSIVSHTNAGSNYEASYQPADQENNKLFFRIKQYEQSGAVKYTAVRIVNLSMPQVPAMKVYPTLVNDYMQIYFVNTPKDDWNIKIINMHGQIMQQSDISRSNYIKIPVSRSLPSGIYIVEAVNKRTLLTQMSRIVIQ